MRNQSSLAFHLDIPINKVSNYQNRGQVIMSTGSKVVFETSRLYLVKTALAAGMV